MGNTPVAFRKALTSGDEAKALELYLENPKFRKNLDPNAAYIGRKYKRNTPLHYVCRYAMTRLLRLFLLSKKGNPSKRNDLGQSCLHMLCQGPESVRPSGERSPRLDQSQRAEQSRQECLQLILDWSHARPDDDRYVDVIDINATDNRHSTCLHYAVAAGRMSCVRVLILCGIDLFVEDKDGLTACDHAWKHHHSDLTLILESQMVFSSSSAKRANRVDNGETKLQQYTELYVDLKVQDLPRLKDMLIQQVADILQAPLYTAEPLLRVHEWDIRNLMEAWISDAAACCKRSGVAMPTPTLTLTPGKGNVPMKDMLIQQVADILQAPLYTAEVLLRVHEWDIGNLMEAWLSDAAACCQRSGVAMPTQESTLTLTPGEGDVSMKDMLIQQVADILQAPLYTAEVLLRVHEWDIRNLMEAWMSDAAACCQRSGVAMPTPTLTLTPGEGDVSMCEICLCSISVDKDPLDMSCGHKFCRACWKGFLDVKIQQGDVYTIYCPAYECYQLVPEHMIASIVSREMYQQYLEFEIKAFVDNNPSICWCPAAGCERAVRLTKPPAYRNPQSFPLLPSPAVGCGKGHLFCWECLGEPHEPCDCQMWTDWSQKVKVIHPEELEDVSEAYENAANCLWLLYNSKQCAKCRTTIQKDDGCNHMQCFKCKHEFCWVCLGEWSRHDTTTGGNFYCTHYEVIQQSKFQARQVAVKVEEEHRGVHEIGRFMQYYNHFKRHEQSYESDKKLLETSKEQMEQLSRTLISCDGSLPDTDFVEDGLCELLKARCVLKCSCAYIYFLPDRNPLKERFELMQRDLEMVVEDLSKIVRQPYMETPWHQRIRAIRLVQQKRQKFLEAASLIRDLNDNDDEVT